jgi:uncharacterized protein (TIGR02300 family)
MSTVSERKKALRGTKRVCETCAVRFYDLARDPIVCPSCGAHYTPAPQPAIQSGAHVTSFTGKTGWRSRAFKRPEPALPAADPEHSLTSEAPADQDTTDETVSAGPEDDVVLEHEQDDVEISELTDHDVADAKE